jgi:hypothetical protein
MCCAQGSETARRDYRTRTLTKGHQIGIGLISCEDQKGDHLYDDAAGTVGVIIGFNGSRGGGLRLGVGTDGEERNKGIHW